MLKSLKNTAISLWDFLKKPIDKQDQDQSAKEQRRALISVLTIDIPLMLLLSVIIVLFEQLGLVKSDNHRVAQLLQFAPVWAVYLIVVVAIPFVEELVFRFFLRWRRNYILQLIVALFPNTKSFLYRFWKRRFGIIFYLSAAAFALIHITNYAGENTAFYIFPVLVLPQFIAGFFSGYLRVRYNSMLGYFLHALHNAIFITVAFLLAETVSQAQLDINNDRFSLKIEGVTRSSVANIYDYQQRFPSHCWHRAAKRSICID